MTSATTTTSKHPSVRFDIGRDSMRRDGLRSRHWRQCVGMVSAAAIGDGVEHACSEWLSSIAAGAPSGRRAAEVGSDVKGVRRSAAEDDRAQGARRLLSVAGPRARGGEAHGVDGGWADAGQRRVNAPCYDWAPTVAHQPAYRWLGCPISGKKLDRQEKPWQGGRVSISVSEVQQRLQSVLGLSRTQASRAVDEVLDSLALEVDEFIARRHGELQAQGASNAEIFERIAEELRALRFKAPELSARQIRRRIYG